MAALILEVAVPVVILGVAVAALILGVTERSVAVIPSWISETNQICKLDDEICMYIISGFGLHRSFRFYAKFHVDI